MPCGTCQGKLYINSKVPGSGNLLSKYVIIGDTPDKDDLSSKIPFIGRSGKVLWHVLNHYGFVREDFYITNVVKCFIKKPSQEIVNQCFEILKEELVKCTEKKLIID